MSTYRPPPSADRQANIDKLLGGGLVDDRQKMLSELARLGARLIIQRAVEEEFDSWLGRARYERRPDGPPGKRNGFRPRRVQTGEGELRIEIRRSARAPRRSSRSCSARATPSGCCAGVCLSTIHAPGQRFLVHKRNRPTGRSHRPNQCRRIRAGCACDGVVLVAE